MNDSSHGSPSESTLKRRAVLGSAWTVGGTLARQGLRLAGNLAMTRLLFPEAFGLMALVQIVVQGIQMFADVGISGNIVQSRRGDDPRFLDTAWSVQVLRGLAIWLATLAGALPFAIFYGEPELAWLIPVVGFASVLSGLASPAVLTLRRHMGIRPLVIRDVAAQTLALAVMIAWAFWRPSVVALVAGALVQAATMLASSYLLEPRVRPRFAWDAAAARELYRYGRWVFVSTAITFVLREGDRAVLGRLLDVAEFGVFSIATMWSGAAWGIVSQLASSVLFPLYSRITHARPERLRAELLRARLAILGVFFPLVWALVLGGPTLIEQLYDERYLDAGWMIQILCIGTLGSVMSASCHGVLLSQGDSYRHMLVQVVRGGLLILGIVAGASFGGTTGVLVGVAAARIADYPFLAWALNRYRLWTPGLDLGAYLVSALVIAGGLWLQGIRA